MLEEVEFGLNPDANHGKAIEKRGVAIGREVDPSNVGSEAHSERCS